MSKTLFRFWINWDGTGVWADGDDVSSYVMEAEWFLGARGTFKTMADENTATLVLLNTDGRFNPSNPTSPLYGNVKPYRGVKIEADYDGTVIPLWTGFLDLPNIAWKPMRERTGKHSVTFNCVGIKQLIDRVQINLGIYTGVTADVIVTDALNACLSSPTMDIEIGATLFASYGDNSGDGWRVISEVTEGERGFFFTARDGTLTWWNRHHKIVNTAVLATLDNTTEELYGLTGAEYSFGDDFANFVRVTITPRQSGSSQVLWSLDAPMTIRAGTTETIEARLRKDGGQFVGSSALTASPTWTSGTGLITVDELGGVARITIANSGADAAVLGALTLTGVPTQAQNAMTVAEKNQDSIDELGQREINISLAVGGGYEDAKQISLYELGRRGELQSTIKAIELSEVPNTAMTVANIWKIGERYKISIDSLYVNSDYWCVGEKHTWQTGNRHKMMCYFEPAKTSQFWLIGVAGFSEIGVTTKVVY